ncbi:MAG: 6-carboxytetrahydropterin synthase [Acidobacteriota bacterium]
MAVYRIVKRIEFCYGHRLMGYEGPCARAHGHNALLEVEISSPELDGAGMVRDFGEVKAILGEFIQERMDHRMLLRHDDPLVAALESVGEEVFVMEDNPTAENIARLLFDQARQFGLPVSALRLWENPRAMAEYRPSAPDEESDRIGEEK